MCHGVGLWRGGLLDNAKPVIIFDKDLDATGEDRYLGYDPSTVFLNESRCGRSCALAPTTWVLIASCSRLVLPTASATRFWRPRPLTIASTIPSHLRRTVIPAVAPTRGATAGFNPAGHPMPVVSPGIEWAGYLSYTKALPQYQRDRVYNKFTYFFTNQLGGRVYVSGFNEEGLEVTNAGLTD